MSKKTKLVISCEKALEEAGMYQSNVCALQVKEIVQNIPPLGMGLTMEKAKQVMRLEIWGTHFDRQGEDFCISVAMGGNGQLIAMRRQAGF